MSVSTASAGPVETASLNRSTLFAYGVPGLVTAVPTIPIFTLLPTFYAENVGLGLTATGIILFLGRAFDVITDPLIGWLTDFQNKQALRRMILAGAVIGAPSLIFLLTPPDDAGPLWLLVWSALLYLGWTLIQIPYLSWGAQLSPLYHERTRLTASREGAVLIGIFVSGSLPALFGYLSLEEATRISLIAWFTVVVGIPAFALLLNRVPLPRQQAPAGHGWRGITQNRLFLRLLSAWFLNGLANSVPAILFPLYCLYVLQVTEQERNLLLALYFTAAVIGIPIWLKLSQRMSKHRSWTLAMLVTCPSFAIAATLGSGDAWVFALICLVTGFCLGADLALPPAIQADVADWDRWRYRRNRTAGLFALWNMASKLSLALASLIILPSLASLGLDSEAPDNIAITALAIAYALIPCGLKLSAVLLIRSLPLTPKRHAAVAARLQRRDLILESNQ